MLKFTNKIQNIFICFVQRIFTVSQKWRVQAKNLANSLDGSHYRHTVGIRQILMSATESKKA